MPWRTAASTALRVSTSQTASWNDAATSATGTGSPDRSRASTQRATAVFRPEKEKSKRCRSQVAAGGETAREVDGDAAARPGRPVDVRAAGERQPEQPGDLVEGLPRRVVDGRAERLDAGGHVGDLQQRGVPAADQHRHARLGQRPVLELVDGDVRGEVVDAVQRLAEAERERLRRRDPDEQGAGETGAAGHGDRVDVVQLDPGGLAGPLDRRHHRLEVRPGGDLGDDAAEAGVLLHAGGHRVGEQGVPAHDPDTGLVAGGLDAEHQRSRRSLPCPHSLPPSRSCITDGVRAVLVVARAPADLARTPRGRRTRAPPSLASLHLEQHPLGAGLRRPVATAASSRDASPSRRRPGATAIRSRSTTSPPRAVPA